MANTRIPKVRGLLTKERMKDLQPGMVLRIHVPNADGKHWDWFDVRYIKHYASVLIAADRLSDATGNQYDKHNIGILPYLSGRFSNAYTTIRDEEILG